MYTEKELKEATQVAYLSFLTKASDALRADGQKGPFTIDNLIRASINVKSAYDDAIAAGVSEKEITTQVLVKYSDMKEFDKSIIEEFSRDMFDWKITHINDQNFLNGLYSCLIETSSKEAIVAFRGSENMSKYSNMINDWLRADLALLSNSETTQQEKVAEYADYLLENGLVDKYDSLAVTGHSLGGNLASHFTISAATYNRRELFGKINQSINFDGPGVSDEYIKAHDEQIKTAAPKLKHLKWSAVGDLLFDIPGEETEFLDIDDELYKDDMKERIKYKVITRHSTKSLVFDEEGKATRGKQDIVSKGLSAISKAADKLIPTSTITELYAVADWIFERALRIKEDRTIKFRDVEWAERFAKKGSVLGKCASFINKAIDTFEKGALALEGELSSLFGKQINNTPKLAVADVYGCIMNDNSINYTSIGNVMNELNIGNNRYQEEPETK